jgi:hypothetical protein
MGAFERLRLALGIVAVIAWVVSIGVDIFVPAYDPPQSIQFVVLIVAGSLFAPTVVRKVNGVMPKDEDG